MRHVKRLAWGLAQYAVAVFLVWHALGGSGVVLQAMAIVSLALWAGVECFRALARLLEAFQWHSDDGGGGPDEHRPIVIRTNEEIPREATRGERPTNPLPGRWRN
jgi:hypothetical protein